MTHDKQFQLYADAVKNELQMAYQQGRVDAIKEYHDRLSKEMHDLWRFYKADTNNRIKPSFMCAYSMVDLIAEMLKEKNNERIL